ncbi:MAG: acetyl-CoA hydrolase/transferase C-terminal domain-containing protein [Sporolactobacillus sp.]
MNWEAIYQQRTVSAEAAIKEAVKSDDHVFVAQSVAEPFSLTEALATDYERLHNVEVFQNRPVRDSFFTKPQSEGHIRYNLYFVGGTTRKAVIDGKADFTPVFYYELPELFDHQYPLDVALVQVSRPDKHGLVSFGINVDYQLAAARKAKVVVAEVNDQMPFTLGDSTMSVRDIDYFVETSRPLPEEPAATADEVGRAIGKNVASLIEDGSNLQFGYGAVPEAAIEFLKDRKDLGIYTEMFSDHTLELIESGAVTNKYNPVHPGKVISSVILGSKKLYDFVDKNNNVFMYPVEFVNNPANLAKVPKLVSVNACVQVDFMGQVNAETIGSMQISGIGGQLDFVRGAAMSPGGKSIIVCPSTAKKGSVSRIVPTLDPGAAVTTTRHDVHYVITEYGIAELKGHSLRERAQALIRIAHPKFREELAQAYEDRFKQTYAN